MSLKLLALFALLSPAFASAQSSAIDRIRTSKVVTMAYRTNALPFSFRDASGQPAGYTVELCKRIAVIAGKVKDAGKYVMLPDNLSFEPYAIALPRNDSALRLEVNRGLSEIFRSPAIKEIFERTFGGGAEPTALLQAVYLIGQIPE